ncbi:hypothetical protein ACFY3N_19745 [Streptomyces sp. NPDC000348]|uniref:hypothetical protein n=1 Tax=Streptomyces sp. NPDC000348 TaxID=3364538 RepID=UPI00369796C8
MKPLLREKAAVRGSSPVSFGCRRGPVTSFRRETPDRIRVPQRCRTSTDGFRRGALP